MDFLLWLLGEVPGMKYTLTKVRAVFTRCGYAVQLLNDDGAPYTRLLDIDDVDGFRVRTALRFPDSGPVRFYGNDGRKVRAEAIAFARSYRATPA